MRFALKQTKQQYVTLSKENKTFITCVQRNIWRTRLSRQGRNVMLSDGICHYISDLVCYGRYCVAVSSVRFIPRRRVNQGFCAASERILGVDKGSVILGFSELWLGRKKRRGRYLLWTKASEEETYLPKIHMYHHKWSALPPEPSFKRCFFPNPVPKMDCDLCA